MNKPPRQFLNAEEIDHDPTVARHSEEWQMPCRSRSGRKAGAYKMQFDEPYVRVKYSMKDSPAWRALSLPARQVLDRLEIELGRHKGRPESNGEIISTYEDFERYGIRKNSLAGAIREVVALGFVRITRKGSAGNENYRQPTLYLLTYQIAGSDQRLSDDWKRIQTDEEADAIAKAAKAAKTNQWGAEFGRKGGLASRAGRSAGVISETLDSGNEMGGGKSARSVTKWGVGFGNEMGGGVGNEMGGGKMFLNPGLCDAELIWNSLTYAVHTPSDISKFKPSQFFLNG
jgi:hypothetical protein